MIYLLCGSNTLAHFPISVRLSLITIVISISPSVTGERQVRRRRKVTEYRMFSLQLKQNVVLCLFLAWFPPPIYIYPFVCRAIRNITLSLLPPFIDPLYCCRDLCSVLPAATELHTQFCFAEEKSMCRTCNIAKGHSAKITQELYRILQSFVKLFVITLNLQLLLKPWWAANMSHR